MHNIWNRLNSLVFSGLGALAILSVATIMTTWSHEEQPVISKLELNQMSALQRASSRSPYSGEIVFVDRAIVTLDVDAGV
jgi:hypothetical protein